MRDLARSKAAAMVRAIVGLCAAPGVDVVAEGVETAEELSLVRGVGCTAVQGFVFSQPLLGEQAARLVGAGQPATALEPTETMASVVSDKRPATAWSVYSTIRGYGDESPVAVKKSDFDKINIDHFCTIVAADSLSI